MHTFGNTVTTLFALCICACGAQLSLAATIYKTVDAEGRVSYSDRPAGSDAAAEAIELDGPRNRYTPTAAANAPPETGDGGDESQAPPVNYAGVEILSPTPNETVRSNEGTLNIRAVAAPPVANEHRMLAVLNGSVSPAAASDGLISLHNLDRGTHTLVVRIVDARGDTLTQSRPVTFHMQRVSVLNRGASVIVPGAGASQRTATTDGGGAYRNDRVNGSRRGGGAAYSNNSGGASYQGGSGAPSVEGIAAPVLPVVNERRRR